MKHILSYTLSLLVLGLTIEKSLSGITFTHVQPSAQKVSDKPFQALPPEALDKPLNEVTFVMTHNSTSLRTKETKLGNVLRKIANTIPIKKVREKLLDTIKEITLQDPNLVADQEQPIEQQLKDGVRAFKIPVHLCNVNGKNELYSCHTLSEKHVGELVTDAQNKLKAVIPTWVPGGAHIRGALLAPLTKFQKDRCKIDRTRKSLADIFKIFNQWLDQNPSEIIILYMDSAIPHDKEIEYAPQIEKLLRDSGLKDKMYTPPQYVWLTINEHIKQNKRFIPFASQKQWHDLGIRADHELTFWSNYNFKNLKSLNDDSNNPQIAKLPDGRVLLSPDRLFVLHNYTTPRASGNILDAQKANQYDTLMARVRNYEKNKDIKHVVNFIMVDFYDVPSNDAVKVAKALNKMTAKERIT